ncbi:MAG: MDR family oxidoreductase [Dongiaceae bacterium]
MSLPQNFKALVIEEHGAQLFANPKNIAAADLPEGEVTLRIAYSSLNYKDALILNGIGGMVKNYPHVPGIDLAGEVIDSNHSSFKAGQKVLLTGWRVGELWWGGYAQYAKVKAEWLIPLPDGLDLRQAMILGTAGLTAMLALIQMEKHGLEKNQGPILVTGAGGGVGSLSVALLANLGYEVAAVTGRASLGGFLQELGAKKIIPRAELTDKPFKPLDSQHWAGAIDSVGGVMLAHILAQIKAYGTVAACGLAGGGEVPLSLMPFLLRGVRLIGIDSATCPSGLRLEAWARLAQEMPKDKLDKIAVAAPLRDLPKLANKMLSGQVQGRIVVDVNV